MLVDLGRLRRGRGSCGLQLTGNSIDGARLICWKGLEGLDWLIAMRCRAQDVVKRDQHKSHAQRTALGARGGAAHSC